CPMCYCNLCFVDQNKPVWFGKTTDLPDIIVFHLIRALHLAGRCVACGACTSVCPMGIDLNLITRKLEKIAKERFDFTSGIDFEQLPPMMSFKMEDEQEYMLEED
ncbi:MAG: 4Fe-4S ferredoxin, partial [Promethearchaeota archaeon]